MKLSWNLKRPNLPHTVGVTLGHHICFYLIGLNKIHFRGFAQSFNQVCLRAIYSWYVGQIFFINSMYSHHKILISGPYPNPYLQVRIEEDENKKIKKINLANKICINASTPPPLSLSYRCPFLVIYFWLYFHVLNA